MTQIKAIPDRLAREVRLIAGFAGCREVRNYPLTPDAAVRLANQLTDAVDEMERVESEAS